MPIHKNTKQMKITKLIKRNAVRVHKDEEDVDDLLEEVRQLEETLKQKQNELFEIQRNRCRKEVSAPKMKDAALVNPGKIILQNSINSLEKNLELFSMLTGTTVQSYVAGEHCSVVFHMQHESEFAVTHGLRIEMDSGKNMVTSSSMPLGFNLPAVMEGFDNVMKPDCLVAIRKALVAYYDRQEQFDHLKKLLQGEAELFKILDGSYMEISFSVHSAQDDEQEGFPITLALQYRVCDIKPKSLTIKEDLPEGSEEVIHAQCAVFKKKPLHKAFKQAFLDGIGLYTMIQQRPRSP